jgi:prephenate dehydrogenase
VTGEPGPLLIVGTGLIGTSAGLALSAAGVDVLLDDPDPAAVSLACDLGAGHAWHPGAEVDVVLLAAPPSAIPGLVLQLQDRHPAAVFTDVASVKSTVVDQVRATGGVAARFVGGHPVAGREVSGAAGAQADLFEGRPWVLTPETADAAAVDRVETVVRLTGAVPVRMSAARHDVAMALVSHVPQATSSMLAAALTSADADLVGLAGQGLRDTTRIAGSDPRLWTDILLGNAEAVAATLAEVADRLVALQTAVQQGDAERVGALLSAGVAGRDRIPGKHGGRAAHYTVVTVVIPDEPGALARLLVAAGDLGVNVEDLRIEHSPGQPVGLAELSVRPDQAARLASDLAADGWRVH